MSRKSRSRDDTWTTEELDKALKSTTSSTEDNKRHRDRNMNDKKRRSEREHKPRKEEPISDDDRKPPKDEQERERQREERRNKRERKDKPKNRDDKSLEKDEKKDRTRERHSDNNEENRRSNHRSSRGKDDDDDDKRRSTHRSNRENDVERKQSHRSGREHVEEKRQERHRSNRENQNDKRRSHKSSRDNDDKRMDQYKSSRENGDEKRKSHQRSSRDDDGRRRIGHRSSRQTDGNRKGNHKSSRDNDEIKDHHKSTKENEKKDIEKRHRQEESKGESKRSSNYESEDEDDDYNYENDDFENYEEDFEVDDESDDSEPERSLKDKEMNDILRALNEENKSLVSGSAGSRSEDIEQRGNMSDVGLSKLQEKRPRTFINFVSAKQRAVDQKVSSKTRKRYKDLVSLIEFDKTEFVMFDLPPVKEYDLYIRSFGRSDSKQAYIQTNEDDIDREVQTEEIEYRDKWTQHPAEDFLGCGGDDIEQKTNAKSEYISKHQTEKIAQFVSKAAQVIGILLDEESGLSSNDGTKSRIDSNLSISSDYMQLGTPIFLQGRYVEFASFSSSQPNILLTLYSCSQKNATNNYDTKGILCIWNVLEPSNPQKILVCESQPACCCLSPRKPLLACAGMVDGSIMMWDLREDSSMHQMITIEQQDYIFRYPTYNTAGISESENHCSRVSSLLPVYPDPTSLKYEEENTSISLGLSFQLASCADNGSINLWVVAEIAAPDSAGSELDLGLQPGGRIKLVKSSSFKVQISSQMDVHHTSTYDFKFSPNDLNQYYVGTDIGFILHGVRLGTCPFPRSHSTTIDRPVSIKSIDLSPFGHPYILAGSCDGCIYLYHTGLEYPLLTWCDLVKGKLNSISFVRWSRSRPGVFFVLDDQSILYTFDLLEGDFHPVKTEQISSGCVVHMTLSNDCKIVSPGSVERSPQLLLALDNGKTELHNISKDLVQQQTLEHEFLMKYNERF
ncbi:cytoplasmic dynein 2 intermediate chain 1 [Patella vulgata]|uniref:cytoplasmic dynein 2 intermediate chain 1 n=1 Tax=Patella vulgata TaxID=6465 RepID=UPI0021808631|nr:cytoplasmic dynein 2 intermediate chain 1 [Patella vulgata]